MWPTLNGRHRFSAVGLMSGTSMDGVDAALVAMDADPLRPAVELVDFVSVSYPEELRESLAEFATGAQITADEVAVLATSVAVSFAAAFFDVCRHADADPRAVDFIGSHGQTVAHVPPGAGSAIAGSLQLGPPAMIAALTGITTVGDFRGGDVAIGGQGAPLAPYCDYMLRRGEDGGRIILNLGGIANLTYLPASGALDDVVAFDAGPGNMVTDALFRALFPGHGDFDEDGVRARAGTACDEICDQLLQHPFFAVVPPRSAGHREFGPHFAWTLKNAAEARGLSREDTMATATALTVRAIVDAIQRFLPAGGVKELFVTGGGARNRAMTDALEEQLPATPPRPIDELGVPAEAKEAVDFAFLARETLLGRTNVIRSVTGASRALVLGTIARG